MQMLLPFMTREQSPKHEVWEQFTEEDRRVTIAVLGRLLLKAIKENKDQGSQGAEDARA